ncbi:SRPBCC family protein [Glaciihabitans sp. INWT7]|uniref:SRPBCC family protein n=1 Tax=Glaciihabitans sp. INWT7 TaxID=2596912 RepID=UPI001624CA7B|nr:SRPBCC family protein [Glaciihabitans sp. INWT7]QNE45671.1 SRPBCC family protein [Glaciihabitans sp. INWT7]
MSVNVREMACSPEDVFAVLADGWVFTTWVVGASRMRDVDENWPAVGSALQHSFGVWPALINDETTVLECDPPRHLVMQPKGWPLGEAKVVIDVKARGNGSVVRIEEFAVAGPASWIPRPVLDFALYRRNVETLQRLAFIAEGRSDDRAVRRMTSG